MYPLYLRTAYSKKTYTFTWIIEGTKDFRQDFQSGPLFEVNGENWLLQFHKCADTYSFRLCRRVSGFDVVVNATIDAFSATGSHLEKLSKKLLYEKSDTPDFSLDLSLSYCNYDAVDNEMSQELEDEKRESSDTDVDWDALSDIDFDFVEDASPDTGSVLLHKENDYDAENTVNCACNAGKVNFAETKKSISWKNLNKNKCNPNKLKFKLNLEFCVLLTSIENVSTNEELQKQAQISLAKDTLAMINKETDIDIGIFGQRAQGHKFILAARCPVLKQIFLENPDKKTIEIGREMKDVNPKTLDILFDFIYTRVRYDYTGNRSNGDNTSSVTLYSMYSCAKLLGMNDLKTLISNLVSRNVAPKSKRYE